MDLGGGFLPVPRALMRLAAGIMARVSRSPVNADALTMLEQGNTGAADGLTEVLGRPPRPLSSFLAGDEASAMRRRAQLDWLLPPARWAVAAMWLVTAFVSAFVYPVAESLELLARTGITGAAGPWALYGAVGFNAVLGLGLLLAPRWRRWLYRAQIALVLFYTVMISWALPEFWAHPYGPVLKNLPILALLAILHALDHPED
ncbi:MAG: DoxX-like family protein [Xanthomonadales bacterium]|nr:DoxX-like family protein [Xanthomonadales bacterium]